MKKIKMIIYTSLLSLVFLLGFSNFTIADECEITKTNGMGFTTTITSVSTDCDGYYTIVLTVEHDGCGGPVCKELSHYSVEADEDTYSNISVDVQEGGMSYGNIDYGWNLGSDPFNGFKIDGINGIGDGQAGVFTITYTLTELQDQQTSAKAGSNANLASFTEEEFQQVLNCQMQGSGPQAFDDSGTTEEDTPLDVNVLSNDVAGNADIDPTSVTFVSGTEPPASEGVFSVDPVTGLVTFAPANGFTGSTSIDYEVCDLNCQCDEATITITVTSGGTDTDDDGCPDDVDDYPNDPDRCFDIYYPASGDGTLAYEDLWPGKGDYDFNDLVIDYRFKTVTNANNMVVEIFADFTIAAFGAGFENGFGFQFANNNVAAADVLSVTGYNLQEGIITLDANGLEDGQSKPTIIVYDNSYNIMEFPGSGIGVNTSPGAPYVDPETLNIYIDIKDNTYSYSEVDIPNFNPFIFADQTRGREVHLPDYPPTDLVDNSYFGTWEDDSDPNSGRYYKTTNNLPWAININENFDYPKEKALIISAYNFFQEWAESGGTSYQDWYQENPGYRNNSNIYQIP